MGSCLIINIFLTLTNPLPSPSTPQVLDLREGSTLATGTDAVVGPWSMHAVEAASSRKKSSTRLDYLTLPTDGEYDYILQVGHQSIVPSWAVQWWAVSVMVMGCTVVDSKLVGSTASSFGRSSWGEERRGS